MKVFCGTVLTLYSTRPSSKYWDGWGYQNGWIFGNSFRGGGGGGICNPKIYFADFGPLYWALERAFRKNCKMNEMRGGVSKVVWNLFENPSVLVASAVPIRVNIAPEQTIIFGLQILLYHRSLSSIDQKILMTLPPHFPITPFSILGKISIEKNVFFRALPKWGGGRSTHARFFWPFFKKCIFGQ